MNLQEVIGIYKRVGQRKGAEFLFNWLYGIYQKVYLPCIDIKYKDVLAFDKTKLTIFDVLIDDLADNYKLRNEKFLEEFANIPWSKNKKYENKYLEVGKLIWEECMNSIRTYPRFNEFRSIFFFDLHQVINAMRYSFLVNTLNIDNKIEDQIYSHHGCMVILHCDMDLMCSKDFDIKELRNMRVIFYIAQRVASIGNMLNTYRRETIEKDSSSPIISLALRRGLISGKFDSKDMKTLEGLEKLFKDKARTYIKRVETLEDRIKSVNIKGFSRKLEELLNAFIQREHYWER